MFSKQWQSTCPQVNSLDFVRVEARVMVSVMIRARIRVRIMVMFRVRGKIGLALGTS